MKNKKNKYSQLVQSIRKEIENTWTISNTTLEKVKSDFVEMMKFMFYKITFSYVKKLWHWSFDAQITQGERNKISDEAEKVMNVPKFETLLEDEWCWAFIKTEIPMLSFGDFPFHFRPNWTNNLSEFYEKKWSHVYFPIASDLCIVIERPTEEWLEDSYKEMTLDQLVHMHKSVYEDRNQEFATSLLNNWK